MPTMSFRVPAGLPELVANDLLRSSIAGGHDHAPTPTQCALRGEHLFLTRDIHESGAAYIPWLIPGLGQFVTPTTTLLFREKPYDLSVELARGKLNQVRNQYSDWVSGGLSPSPEVEALVKRATRSLSQALFVPVPADADRLANESIAISFDAANILAAVYQAQVYQLRHERQGPFETVFGCGIDAPPAAGLQDAIAITFNSVNVPLTWRTIEAIESTYRWDEADAAIEWALDRGLQVQAGPLIDFSPNGLPDFARRLGNDPVTLKSLMCDYIETVVNRYRGKVSRWLVAGGANGTIPLGVSEEDLIRLTAMAADAAWQIDSTLQVSFGIANPWGDYLGDPSFQYSPFVFADTLLRAGLPFAGIDVELFLGSSPRGSYCRDLLETSRMLDLFGMLGVPIQVALSFPSAAYGDPLADPMERGDQSGTVGDFSLNSQANWADAYTSLALCKSFVAGVIWDHLSDARPHRFPNGGLIGSQGEVKPAFDRMRALRAEHLK